MKSAKRLIVWKPLILTKSVYSKIVIRARPLSLPAALVNVFDLLSKISLWKDSKNNITAGSNDNISVFNAYCFVLVGDFKCQNTAIWIHIDISKFLHFMEAEIDHIFKIQSP